MGLPDGTGDVHPVCIHSLSRGVVVSVMKESCSELTGLAQE